MIDVETNSPYCLLSTFREEMEDGNQQWIGSSGSQLDLLDSSSETSDINVSDLMLEAYRAIGDPDGVYGCGFNRLGRTIPR